MVLEETARALSSNQRTEARVTWSHLTAGIGVVEKYLEVLVRWRVKVDEVLITSTRAGPTQWMRRIHVTSVGL